jgi:hypothetical protein
VSRGGRGRLIIPPDAQPVTGSVPETAAAGRAE